ncbi:MAG TPA: hypothetical protein VFE17_02555 [Candidatus Baltobacteraceae bacterium]|nr:hypothetical protein [Candidatus Baltobacteraceae bacterium]
MESPDLREAWAALETHLAHTERLNDLLVAQSMTARAKAPLAREQRLLGLEIVLNYIALIAIGSFAADNFSHRVVFLSAVILGVALIVANVVTIGILVGIRSIDFDEPVVAIQSVLERMKMRRSALVAAELLTAPLLWTPLLVVALTLMHVDAVRVLGVPYLAANVAVTAAIAAGVWMAAHLLARREGGSRWMTRAADILSGRSYRDSSDFLDTIDRFQSRA